MLKRSLWALTVVLGTAAIAGVLVAASRVTVAATEDDSNGLAFADPTGEVRTIDVNGILGDDRDSSPDNPFFQDLGTNGRRCVTCHQASDAMSITPPHVRERFAATNGSDPIFTSNDGSNCEGVLPQSLADKRAAYSLLLTRGLIRIGLNVPPAAEFVIERATNPYHCGPATNDASLYRRPLPSTNLRFLTAVMWDGRESSPTTTVLQDLAHQANDATRGHAQGARDLTPLEAQQIVAFETGLFTAQERDLRAGTLHARGAAGGPATLVGQPFFTGVNDPVGLNPSGAAFNPNAFSLFNAWASLAPSENSRNEARLAVARGEVLFNTKPITLSGVAGLNGQTFSSGVTLPASFSGTCTVCHDTPNAGDHSVKAPLNIGLTDPIRAPYLPVYTLRNVVTRETVETTDLGRAMVTGKWADVGKFKGPILRALAARAPYFHNGSAATLEEVLDFYETRFNLGLTAREKADLVAFLRSL
jgi:cytochrome c peroxidase